jgi:glycosyltransferase involved in cell wall biosynthesis
MKLSVVIPVYNEWLTIDEVLARVRRFAGPAAAGSPAADTWEMVIVDDGSTDGTREYLKSLPEAEDTVVVFHERNRGKGAAVRTGLQHVRGDVILIQDADLEYDPADYPRLLAPIRAGQTQVVYGSRRLADSPADMSVAQRVGNRWLTWAANALYGSSLTDLETCYKVFTRAVAERLDLRSARWGFDPEITAQILRLGYHIHEVPTGYHGRTAAAGKKIRWRHGLSILGTLLRCRLGDEVFWTRQLTEWRDRDR